MKQSRTHGIVLTRVDYGEADRIITMLTPEGKITLMVRGVRRIKSKLAGGVELFSVSEMIYAKGKGSIDTLISTRLIRHHGSIVHDIERTMFGYELLKILHSYVEDTAESAYYALLEQSLIALDTTTLSLTLIRTWFSAQLLRIAGYTPNLKTSVDGGTLQAVARYQFDSEAVAFRAADNGNFSANDIKFLRFAFADIPAYKLANIEQAAQYLEYLEPFVLTLRREYLHI